MTLTRRYRFSASHRLHSAQLSDEENDRVFGKCNNPYGHGHDYILDVSVTGSLDAATGRIVDLDILDRIVREQILEPFEHHNLNLDVPVFANIVPTTENLAVEVAERLSAAWSRTFPAGSTTLAKIRIHETRNNTFELEPATTT